jgi:hypothetical protein
MQYSTINVWGKSSSGRAARKLVGGSLVIGVGAAAVGLVVGVGVAAAPIIVAKLSVEHIQNSVRKHRLEQQRRDQEILDYQIAKILSQE